MGQNIHSKGRGRGEQLVGRRVLWEAVKAQAGAWELSRAGLQWLRTQDVVGPQETGRRAGFLQDRDVLWSPTG